MIKSEDASSVPQKDELKQLIRDAKLLITARSISLPIAGVGSIVSIMLGPLAFLGAAGLGSAIVAVSKHQFAHKANRAFALTAELRSKNELTETEYQEYIRILREATEGSTPSKQQ